MIKIGSDPEVFVVKDGNIIPCVGIFKGTKKKPEYINGLSVQEDNVSLEFNTEPASSLDEFIVTLQDSMLKIVEITGSLGLSISDKNLHEFSDEQLTSKQAKTFGCDPDYNAYTASANDPCTNAGNVRVCGGHLHFGLDREYDRYEIANMVRLADIFITLRLLKYEQNSKRRQFYGQAGSFRFKSYGFEYRTPSNFWIFNRDVAEEMYRSSIEIVEMHNKGYETRPADTLKIVSAINDHNVPLANRIYEDYRSLYGRTTGKKAYA